MATGLFMYLAWSERARPARGSMAWRFFREMPVLALFLLGPASVAQEVTSPPPAPKPATLVKPPPSRIGGTSQLNAPPAETSTAEEAAQGLVSWGRAHLRPHLLYRISYGDNLQSKPGESSQTTIQELSPGVTVQLGNLWSLDYTPTLRFYSSSSFDDGVDHSVSLTGGGAYENWTFGLVQNFNRSSQPLVETGGQTDQDTYSTALNAAGQLSTKLSLELGVNQNLRFTGQDSQSDQATTDSKDWSTMEWLNYQFWPAFGAALGAGFGYSDVSEGSDMTYEQVQGRINWMVGNKLSLLVNGGFEVRQFLDSSEPDAVNPIMGLTANYQLFEATTLTLNVDHTVNTSYYESQITETTTINAGLRQRLFKKLHLDVNGGYSTSSYDATSTGLTVTREDDYTHVDFRLSAPFLKRGTAAVFYQMSEDSSNQSDYNYSSSQYGMEIGYRF